jgi:hypothetical protein
VNLYAVVSDEIQRVIEFFLKRAKRRGCSPRLLWDEPDCRDILHVEQVETSSLSLP